MLTTLGKAIRERSFTERQLNTMGYLKPMKMNKKILRIPPMKTIQDQKIVIQIKKGQSRIKLPSLIQMLNLSSKLMRMKDLLSSLLRSKNKYLNKYK